MHKILSGPDRRLNTASGDIICPGEISAERLNIKNVSGDTELAAVRADNADFYTVSGDIECTRLNVSRQLTMKSVSGDILLSSLSCPMTDISGVSGDVSAVLTGPVSCSLKSATGEIRYPAVQAGCDVLRITTVSGDISVSEPE